MERAGHGRSLHYQLYRINQASIAGCQHYCKGYYCTLGFRLDNELPTACYARFYLRIYGLIVRHEEFWVPLAPIYEYQASRLVRGFGRIITEKDLDERIQEAAKYHKYLLKVQITEKMGLDLNAAGSPVCKPVWYDWMPAYVNTYSCVRAAEGKYAALYQPLKVVKVQRPNVSPLEPQCLHRLCGPQHRPCTMNHRYPLYQGI